MLVAVEVGIGVGNYSSVLAVCEYFRRVLRISLIFLVRDSEYAVNY
jgi:hypothetical protein